MTMLIEENENLDGNELETVSAEISKLGEEAIVRSSYLLQPIRQEKERLC